MLEQINETTFACTVLVWHVCYLAKVGQSAVHHMIRMLRRIGTDIFFLKTEDKYLKKMRQHSNINGKGLFAAKHTKQQ